MKKKPTTAAELWSELASDPEYQKMRMEMEQRRASLKRKLQEDQRELIAACHSVGTSIDSVWDLVNTTEKYDAVIPILVDHLEKPHHPRTQEGIVRALTVSEARGVATEPLIRMFRSIADSESEIKWLVGSAIAKTATERDAGTVLELIKDERHGASREFLPYALIHLPRKEAHPILEHLTADPVMGKVASEVLSILAR